MTVPIGEGRSDAFVVSQALHEVLHMFGIQHDRRLDSKEFREGGSYAENPRIYVNGDYDELSLMVRASADRPPPPLEIGRMLSEGDVQCLQKIGSGQFESDPQTLTSRQIAEGVRAVPTTAPVAPRAFGGNPDRGLPE